MTVTSKRPAPLLSESLPALAAELEDLLAEAGEEALVSQVRTLRVKSRCNCGDDFCATIYTGSGRPDHSVDLEPSAGMLILDVDGDKHIVGIEILDRPEYKAVVDALFSESSRPSPRAPLPKGEG